MCIDYKIFDRYCGVISSGQGMHIGRTEDELLKTISYRHYNQHIFVKDEETFELFRYDNSNRTFHIVIRQ